MVVDERWRPVIEALGTDGPARHAAIASLSTAEQLHQFALNYNPNDDPVACAVVAEHPACNRGTALTLLWLFADILLAPGVTASGEAAIAVSRIRARLTAGRFASEG